MEVKLIDGCTVSVNHVYSGKAMRCTCGCSGKHMYDEPSIARYVKKIIKSGIQEIGHGFFCHETPTRMYVAYFEESK